MRWETVLFAHWPVPVEALRPVVPEALEIESSSGTAWIGLVPFTMPVFRTAWLPPLPGMHRFHECNVRTYVVVDGEPGIYFLSLDAGSRLAVWGARRLWRLNYHLARIDLRLDGDEIRYSVDRAADSRAFLRCVWRAGRAITPSRPGDLAHFLTERYMLYTTDRRGRPMCGRIWHQPWSLREAQLLGLEDGLVAAAGIDVPDETPVLYHADALDVLAWPPQRAGQRRAAPMNGADSG